MRVPNSAGSAARSTRSTACSPTFSLSGPDWSSAPRSLRGTAGTGGEKPRSSPPPRADRPGGSAPPLSGACFGQSSMPGSTSRPPCRVPTLVEAVAASGPDRSGSVGGGERSPRNPTRERAEPVPSRLLTASAVGCRIVCSNRFSRAAYRMTRFPHVPGDRSCACRGGTTVEHNRFSLLSRSLLTLVGIVCMGLARPASGQG